MSLLKVRRVMLFKTLKISLPADPLIRCWGIRSSRVQLIFLVESNLPTNLLALYTRGYTGGTCARSKYTEFVSTVNRLRCILRACSRHFDSCPLLEKLITWHGHLSLTYRNRNNQSRPLKDWLPLCLSFLRTFKELFTIW